MSPVCSERRCDVAAGRRTRGLPPAILAAACLALGLLSGCGSSSSTGTSADPAAAVPASVPLYVGAEVRPQGAEREAALAAGRSLTHQANPYVKLLGALALTGSPPLQYDRDVAPWLGQHAGIFLTSLAGSEALVSLLEGGLLGGSAPAHASFPFSSGGAQGAIVLDTRDVTSARSFLATAADRAGAHLASYRGVSYRLTPGGIAFAIVHRYAVIGTEMAVRSVIDTTLGGPALVGSPGYQKLLSVAPTGVLAHLYSDPGALAQVSAATSSRSGLLGLLAGASQANISLVPAAGSLTLDADSLATAATGTPSGLLGALREGAPALADLPGDSWLGIGLGDLGGTLSQDVAGLSALAGAVGGSAGAAPTSGSGLINLGSLVEGLISPLRTLASGNARARAQFTSWMGSGGIYASGANLIEIKGAIVIESHDPALSKAAVGRLGASLRAGGDQVEATTVAGTDAAVAVHLTGVPLMLYIANGRNDHGGTDFVLGLGEPSVTEALHPASTLGSAALTQQAASLLGEGIQPSVVADAPTLVGLLEGLGLAEDPTIGPLLPDLRSVTTVAGGGKDLGGGVQRYRLHIGLRTSG